MLDTVKSPLLSVTEFPWVKDPVNPKTKEEHAYTAGQHIARTRALLDDDSLDEIINWGAGPGNRRSALDVDKLKEQSEVGPFGIFVAIEPDDLDLYRQVLPTNFSMP